MTKVKSKLASLEVKPSKTKGQNFLIDHSVIDRIISFGSVADDETIIEIGPGLGALTERLILIKDIYAIEIEEEFSRHLKEKFKEKIIIYNEDARNFDYSKFQKKVTIFSNIPYSFSSEILLSLVKNRKYISRAVLMFQKEFAERVSSPPGYKAYGSLSVAVQLFADVKRGFIVPGHSFHPPTKVASQVIELTFHEEPKVPIDDVAFFEKVVRASFLKKRKTILNSLLASGFFDKGKIVDALASSGIDPIRRAETCSLDDFARLSKAFMS